MFHIKIKLKESPLQGIGLYADENIKQGQKIFSENPDLVLIFTSDQFSQLSEDSQQTVRHYGFFDKTKKLWHLSFEDIRFCNHEVNATMTLQNSSLVATRDIQQGEELTEDYSEFEDLRDELKEK